MTKTPAEAGFRMPAEWEKHEGTWLQWPHDDTYPGNQMRLEHIWLAMTEALHQHETVHIVVTDERGRDHLQQQVAFYGFDQSSIDIHVLPTDDVWARDSGPIFLVNDRGELAATDWNFNGWGERYPFAKDRKVPAGIAEMLSVPVFTAPITLEGSGVEVNGKGTLLATRSSIANPWFPEAARLTAMRGAEIILIPTAIGYSRPEPDPAYQESWQVVQRGHAVANACYLAAVNRVGFEASPDGQGGIDFWGRSFVADPDGKVLGEASENEEEILVCPVDLALIEEVRDAWSFPFRDRRVDSYGGLTKLYLDSES